MTQADSRVELYGEVVESFLAELRRGDAPTVEDYARRYPLMADELRRNIPTLMLLEQVKEDAKQQMDVAIPEHSAELKQLGDYRLLREIGRGGMGVVYQAEQESLGRHVAVKVLAGHALLNPSYLKRFHHEARAAAGLHHTNIVPVLDVGECQGVHYFVMQYIQGHGLDQVISELRRMVETDDDSSTSLLPGVVTFLSSGSSVNDSSNRGYWRSVVRIGRQAAEALAFAHEHNILHRDVKPSNLLLDEEGTTWVSDFGLAKSAEQESVTQSGNVLGTLRYMAPESIRGQFDQRSDVYGLGLTLYELCSLQPARTASHRPELIQQLTHGDIPRLRHHGREIPRDLVTIIHKAIDPDPHRRYQTAEQLATDLRCFLEDRPIRARRLGMLERTWRWCRRNPTVTVAGILLLITLSIAFTLVTHSRQEAIAALKDAQRQREAAEIRRVQAEDAQQLAQQRSEEDRRNFQWARETVDQYLREVSDDPQLKAHGMEPLRRRLLVTARQFYDDFVQVRTDDASLQLERAKAYRQLASISDTLGDKDEALELLRQSRLILEQSDAGDRWPTESRLELATNYRIDGKTRLKLGQFEEATSAYDQAARLLRGVLNDHPTDPRARRMLADVLGKSALPLLKMGDASAAELMLEEAVVLLDQLIAESPDDVDNLEELASVHSKRAILYGMTRRPDESETARRQAIEMRERMVEQHPDVPAYREKLAVDYMNAANHQITRDRGEDALRTMKTSLAMLQELHDEHSGVELYQLNLAHGYRTIGRIHLTMKQTDKFLESYHQAAAICADLTVRYPHTAIHRRTLAQIWDELAVGCEMLGDTEQAERARKAAQGVGP